MDLVGKISWEEGLSVQDDDFESGEFSFYLLLSLLLLATERRKQPSAKSIKPSAACLASLLFPTCCDEKREYCEELVEM